MKWKNRVWPSTVQRQVQDEMKAVQEGIVVVKGTCSEGCGCISDGTRLGLCSNGSRLR